MTTGTDRSEAHQPTTDIVRARYHLATLPDDTPSEIIEMGRARSYAEFDRWLEQVQAEAKAEALEEAADLLHGEAKWQREMHIRNVPTALAVKRRMEALAKIIHNRVEELANGR